MFGIDDAIIAAVAPAVIGGAMDMIGGNKQNESAEAMQNQANAFSAQQFATRYQTTTEDMKKAGLNPMLAYNAGGGSPPSSVGVAQQVNTMHGAGDIAGKAVGAANIAMQTQLTDAQVAESISRTGVNDEDRKLKSAQTALAILEAPNVSIRGKQMAQQMLLDAARTTATNAEEVATRLLHPKNRAEGDYYNTYGYGPFALRDLGQGVGSAANAFNALRGRQGSSTSTHHVNTEGKSSSSHTTTKYGN